MSNHAGAGKRRLLAALIILAVAAAAAAALLFFSKLEKKADVAPEGAGTAVSLADAEEKTAIYYNGHKYFPNKGLKSLLILGIDDQELTDSDNNRNKSQADFILLAVFDTDAGKCTMLQINRDSMCEIPLTDTSGKNIGTRTEQIALSHTYGRSQAQRCENTVKAVSGLLYGIKVNNYLALTMDGIPVINDLVGGITVTIEDDFTGVDDTLVKGETVTLTADNVENYVRARFKMTDDDTNIARMRRQRTYMTELFKALSQAYVSDDNFVLKAYDALSSSMVSDCTVDELSEYAEMFSDCELTGIVTPEGEAVQGETYIEFYPDEDALKQLVIDTFYREAEE